MDIVRRIKKPIISESVSPQGSRQIVTIPMLYSRSQSRAEQQYLRKQEMSRTTE
jgi:hypothetical protein